MSTYRICGRIIEADDVEKAVVKWAEIYDKSSEARSIVAVDIGTGETWELSLYVDIETRYTVYEEVAGRIMTPKRFWQQVEVGGDNECWPFLGKVNSEGYGWLWFKNEKCLAHRVAAFLVGQIGGPNAFLGYRGPCGYGNKLCCNPAHFGLEAEVK